MSFAKIYSSVCDDKFPSLFASLSTWRCLAASTSYFPHATINLRPPSVAVSTLTSTSFPNRRMSLCLQSVHSFSLPPRPLRTAPPRCPNTIHFGSRPPLIWMSAVAHKSVLVRNVVSMLSHRVISRERL